MLSDRYFRILNLQLTIARYIHAVPFQFSAKERRLFVTQSASMKFSVVYLTIASYLIFYFVQIIQCQRMRQTTHFSYYYLFAMFICYCFNLIAGFPFFGTPKETAAYITELWGFITELQSKFTR